MLSQQQLKLNMTVLNLLFNTSWYMRNKIVEAVFENKNSK